MTAQQAKLFRNHRDDSQSVWANGDGGDFRLTDFVLAITGTELGSPKYSEILGKIWQSQVFRNLGKDMAVSYDG